MDKGEKKSLDNSPRKCWNTLVKKHGDVGSKSRAEPLGALEVKTAHSASQWRQAKAALGREHGLGAGREAGDRLCQLVREDGRLVAVLVWCAAAWHLQARDETVGWDAVTRSKRLKLVVQLRRFLVLEATRRPNLASQCLGAGMRELVGQWAGQHGYRPLLAESFSDPESHAGTVYKATNWVQAGLTKGYAQDHTDFYVPHGRPKKLWLKELAPNACALMCARELPPACQGAEGEGGGARSPLKVSQLQSLREAFRQVPDPRSATSRRHPLAAMLGLIALGLLMGARTDKNLLFMRPQVLDATRVSYLDPVLRNSSNRFLAKLPVASLPAASFASSAWSVNLSTATRRTSQLLSAAATFASSACSVSLPTAA